MGTETPDARGVTFTGLGLIVLSRTNSLGMFYGAMALLAIGVSTSSSTVLMTAVTNWFHRRVGMAIGIAAAGHGFGGLLVPVVVKLIDVYEWRTAMAILGVGMLAIGWPLSLLVRHRPEHYGYHLDGDADAGTAPGSGVIPVQTDQVDFGAKQAVKSRMFWHIALALAFQSMVLGAVTTHIMPYLSSVGIARATAGLAASGVPVLSIIGRLSFGRLADVFDKRQVVAAGFAIMSIGLLFFNYVDTSRMWPLVLFVSLFGIGQGGLVVMRVALLREYFGRTNFGAIHGFIVGIMALGRVAGASLPGMVYDNWGGYQDIWLGFAALIAVSLLIGATMPPLRTQA